MFVTLHAICMAGIPTLLRVIRDFRQGKTRLFPDGAEREYVLPVKKKSFLRQYMAVFNVIGISH